MLTVDPVQADPDSQRMLKYDWWSKYTCSVKDKLQQQQQQQSQPQLPQQQEQEQDDYKKDQRDMLDVSWALFAADVL